MTDAGEAKLHVGREPRRVEFHAMTAQLLERVLQILPNVMRQHELVMDSRAPTHQPPLIRRGPERGNGGAHQQGLGERHLRMRRHLEGPELDQAKASGGAVRRIHLVDTELGPVGVTGHVGEDIAEHPVHEPRCRLLARLDPPERDFQLPQRVLPRLVDAGVLRHGSDEQAAEQVGEAGVIVPEAQQRFQQVRAAEERAVFRRHGAHHHVIAAASADVAAVQHEFFRCKPHSARFGIKGRGARHHVVPGRGRVDVHLDHAGIRGHGKAQDAAVTRRLVALEHHLALCRGRRPLDRRDQRQPILGPVERWDKDVQQAIPRLHRKRRPDPTTECARHRVERGERGLHFERIQLRVRLQFGRIDPGEARQRQAHAGRAVAGHEEDLTLAHRPEFRLPVPRCAPAAERQHAGDSGVQALVEHADDARPLLRIPGLRRFRHDVGRHAALAHQPVRLVLIGFEHGIRIDMQLRRKRLGEGLCRRLRGITLAGVRVSQQRRVVPDRSAIRTPGRVQRPARRLLTWIMLAGAILHDGTGRPVRQQARQQLARFPPLGWAERIDGPLSPLRIVHRHEGRLAAHGQAQITLMQHLVHGSARLQNRLPLRLRIGLGDPRRLVHARDRHLEPEIGLRRLHQAGDRRRRLRLGTGGQGNMPLASHQTRRRIEPDPTGAGQVGLRPGVQIGEIGRGTFRTLQRLHVGRQLDQVAAHEPRGVAEMPERMHQQPGAVPAGTAGFGQRPLRVPHAGLEPHDITHSLHDPAVQVDQHVDGAPRLARNRRQQAGQQWARRQ